MISSASRTILEMSSSQVGMSFMIPMTCPADMTPLSMSPSSNIFLQIFPETLGPMKEALREYAEEKADQPFYILVGKSVGTVKECEGKIRSSKVILPGIYSKSPQPINLELQYCEEVRLR